MESTTEHKSKKEESLFEILGPKRSFIFGMVAMFMTACTIGFFILLANGDSLGTGSSSTSTFSGTTNTTNTNAAAANTNSAATINLAAVTSDDHIRGDLNKAEVVLVEYSDTECPFCKQFHTTLQQMSEEYGDQVAWVYRHFPLESLHPNAARQAEATECAWELGGNEGFWAYIDRLYDITPSNNGLRDSQLPEIAEYAGLDVTAFTACLDSGRYADKVQEHYQDAVNAGGNGTPYSVAINKDGTKVPVNGAQPYSSLKATIDGLL